MRDLWDRLLVTAKHRPLGNLATGLFALGLAFAATALARWIGEVAGGWGEVVVVIVAGWLVSVLVYLAMSLLALPSYFGRERALSVGLAAYVIVGLAAWAWALEPLGLAFPTFVVWPYLLAIFHGCFLEPGLWACTAA